MLHWFSLLVNMEKQLKCFLLLSLKEMAGRSLVVSFWNDSDILASISKFLLFGFSTLRIQKKWREDIEDTIKDKILKLGLSEPLTKQMIDKVRPISLNVRRWKGTLQGYLSSLGTNEEIGLPASAKLCFTTTGTVDYQRTAEELVRCNALGIVQRYRIACLFCLEDYIPLLWEDLPEKNKERFYKLNSLPPNLESYWSRLLAGEHSKLGCLLGTSNRNLTTFNQCAFEMSAEKCCKTAAEYFFHKLTHEEREASLMRAAHAVPAYDHTVYPDENACDVLCYLLSLMTHEQQMEIVKARPVKVFSCFFNWPRQDLLLENAGLIWSFLPKSGYGDLLESMQNEYSEFYFPKLFQGFFLQSPKDFKKYFVKSAYRHRFLFKFFESEDSESIKVIFRNVNAKDRMKLVFDRSTLCLFYESLLDYRWHMVKVCLRQAKLCKKDRGRLKKAFLKYNCRKTIERKFRKFKRFFKFLDKTDVCADKGKKARKRKMEES